jgi:hypothetical protein
MVSGLRTRIFHVYPKFRRTSNALEIRGENKSLYIFLGIPLHFWCPSQPFRMLPHEYINY